MSSAQDPTEMFQDWLQGQQSLYQAQQNGFAEFARMMADNAGQIMGTEESSATPSMPDWVVLSQKMDPRYVGQMFQLADQHHKAWLKFADQWQPQSSKGPAVDGLKRMLDPTSWLNMGVDDVTRTLKKLAQGPEFADGFGVQFQMLQSSTEWVELSDKVVRYGKIVGGAWMAAYSDFMAEMTHQYRYRKPEEIGPDDYGAGVKIWLKIANDHLLKTQRSEAFLTAQRDLLRALMAFKKREQKMVEVFCETYAIPTRTEVDDMQYMLHQLRREVRGLKREVGSLKKNVRKNINENTEPTGSNDGEYAQKNATNKGKKTSKTSSSKRKNLPANPYAQQV